MKKILFVIVWFLFILNVFGGSFLFSNEEVDYIKKISKDLNLDYKLILSIADVESDFRWNVIGGSGEKGAFQIKPDTFHWLRKSVTNLYPNSTLDHYDPIYFHMLDTKLSKMIQTEAVCLFIRWLLDQENGDLNKSLQRYNGSYRKEEYAKEVLKIYKSLKN